MAYETSKEVERVGLPKPMPQAFADAVCNTHAKELRYVGLDDETMREELMSRHASGRYRGMEGSNGVACEACKYRARKIWDDYQRITRGINA